MSSIDYWSDTNKKVIRSWIYVWSQIFQKKKKTKEGMAAELCPALHSQRYPHCHPQCLFFPTICVRRRSERFERNTYLAQWQNPVSTPFISPGDGIQYTKPPSCSSITPVLGIRAGLPGNWLVVNLHEVWGNPWRSGDYRKGCRGWVAGSQWGRKGRRGERKGFPNNISLNPHSPQSNQKFHIC